MCPHIHLPAATKRLHVSGCQNSSEHCPWEHIHKDIGGGGGCMFLFLEFLKISGSAQSTKEENSLAKVTTSKLIAQVIMLNYSIYRIIHACFCLQRSLIALCSLHWFLIQSCLRRHCGKKAKTTSSSLKGGFFCPGKTSPSDTSLRETWVVLLTRCGLLSA